MYVSLYLSVGGGGRENTVCVRMSGGEERLLGWSGQGKLGKKEEGLQALDWLAAHLAM